MSNNVLFETELYEVRLVTYRDPYLEADVEGYGVFNKETGVRESELRRMGTAIKMCIACEREYDSAVDEAENNDEPEQEELFPTPAGSTLN